MRLFLSTSFPVVSDSDKNLIIYQYQPEGKWWSLQELREGLKQKHDV